MSPECWPAVRLLPVFPPFLLGFSKSHPILDRVAHTVYRQYRYGWLFYHTAVLFRKRREEVLAISGEKSISVVQEYNHLDGRRTACLFFVQHVQRYALLLTATCDRPGAFKIWYMALDSPILLGNVDSSNSWSLSERARRDCRARIL